MDSFEEVISVGLLSLGALLGLALMIIGVLTRSKQADTPIKIEIRGIGKIDTRHAWVPVMVAGGLLFGFSINTFVQQSRLKASTAIITSENTLTAILKSSVVGDSLFQAQIRNLDKSVKTQIILKAARVLANEYMSVTKLPRKLDAADFSHIEQLIEFLHQIDRNNGHALYFSGEVEHKLNKDEQRDDVFYLYLETEKGLPESEKGGGKEIALCASRVHGYCQQRTGWIQHTLANYLFQKAQKEQSLDIRHEYYSRAIEFAKQAMENYPPDGFDQQLPTKVVKERAAEALRNH